MAGFEYTVGEMKVMPTVAYLNEIVFGVGVLSWFGWALHMAFECPTLRDEILVIPLFQNNANISLFQHNNAGSHTVRDTVNFCRANNIALLMTGLPNALI